MELICRFWIILAYWFSCSIMDFEGTRMECSVDLCGWDRKQMTCNGSVILPQNVTNVRTQLTNNRAFDDLRRMCSGFRDCSTSSFCQTNKLVRAAYICINDYQINKKCPNYAQVLSAEEGYIQSPDYPSALSLKRCVWRISVPKDSYVTFILHDFQRDVDEYSPCFGSLRFRTHNECPTDGAFPSYDICRLSSEQLTFKACGNVEINLIPSDRGYKMRFWLSYKVQKLHTLSTADANDNLPTTSSMCPSGYYDESLYDELIIPHSPGVVKTRNNSTVNQTGVVADSVDRNLVFDHDKTEKTVLYIAVAVAIISLTGLIIVTVICIRQRKFKPHNQYEIEHRIVPQNETLSRPLPPVIKRNSIVNIVQERDRPRLNEGYSVVADNIPYTPREDNVRSPPYAEVEDHVINRNQMLRFGRLGGDANDKKSVENIYSELNDSKDIYHEIIDYNFIRSPCISQNDQMQLIHGKKTSKINPFVAKQCKRPVSFEGPYASNDVTNKRRSGSKDTDCNKRVSGVSIDVMNKRRSGSRDPECSRRVLSKQPSGSLSYRSDSDGSLTIENDGYEVYQSAHV